MSEENLTSSCFVPEDYREPSKDLKIGGLVLLIVTAVLVLVLGALFLRRRSNFAVLRARSKLLLLTLIVGSLFQMVHVVNVLNDGRGIPCSLLSHAIIFTVALQLIPTFIEIMLFYFKVRLNNELARFELRSVLAFASDARLQEAQNPEQNKNLPPALNRLQKLSIPTYWNRKKPRFSLFFWRKKRIRKFNEKIKNVMPVRNSITDLDTSRLNAQYPLEYLFVLSSRTFGNYIMCLFYIATGFIMFFQVQSQGDCQSPCEKQSKDLITGCSSGFIFGIFICYFIYKIKDEPDPLSFKLELMSSIVVASIFGFPTMMLLAFDPGHLESSGTFHWFLIWSFGSLVLILVSLGIPLWLSFAQERSRENGAFDMDLDAVLETETGRSLFKAFLVSEFSVENYLFWRETTLYASGFGERSDLENSQLRNIIVEVYVRESAKMEINISGHERRAIIDRLSNEPTANDFNEALNEVFSVMSNDSFVRFRNTSAFKALQWNDHESQSSNKI